MNETLSPIVISPDANNPQRLGLNALLDDIIAYKKWLIESVCKIPPKNSVNWVRSSEFVREFDSLFCAFIINCRMLWIELLLRDWRLDLNSFYSEVKKRFSDNEHFERLFRTLVIVWDENNWEKEIWYVYTEVESVFKQLQLIIQWKIKSFDDYYSYLMDLKLAEMRVKEWSWQSVQVSW